MASIRRIKEGCYSEPPGFPFRTGRRGSFDRLKLDTTTILLLLLHIAIAIATTTTSQMKTEWTRTGETATPISPFTPDQFYCEIYRTLTPSFLPFSIPSLCVQK